VRTIFITILLIISGFCNGQLLTYYSSNGAFIVILNADNKGQQVNIYSSKYACKIAQIKLRPIEKLHVNALELSENGALLLVEATEGKFVYNVRTLQLLKIVLDENLVTIGSRNNRFYVTDKKLLSVFNTHGQMVDEHKMPDDKNFKDLRFFPNDKNFEIIDHPKTHYLYKTNKTSVARRIFANTVATSTKNQALVTYNQLGKNATITVLSYPKLIKQYSTMSGKFLKLYIKENSKNALLKNTKLVPYQYLFSPQATYISLMAIDANGIYSFFIFDTRLGKITQQVIPSIEHKIPLEHTWVNDSIMAVKTADDLYTLYHAPSGRNATQLKTILNFKPEDKEISTKRQNKRISLSHNLRYLALNYKQGVYFGLTAIKQARSLAKAVTFLEFSPDSRIALVKQNERLGIIKTESIEYDLGTKPLAINWLKDSCVFDVEKILGVSEKPLNHKYIRLEQTQHFSNVTDTTKLTLELQTTTFNKNETTIEFQLLDQFGNHYTGASAEKHHHLWCNLILQKNGLPPSQVKQFSISEVNNDNPKSLALSIVSDYSGSMGVSRIYALENGLKRFFSNKSTSDVISIVKYDDKVETSGKLSHDSQKLISNLDKSGYDKFGGATALLDGINIGIENIKDHDEFDERIVIVITDGNENASILSKNSLILNAIKDGIKVYTIAFGDYVSTTYLKSISHNTGGNFYQIYDTKDLDWIYQDIYNRINNYYQITFKTSSQGQHKLLLKLCLDNQMGDSLALQFDNSTLDLSAIDPYSDQGFEIPFNSIDVDSIFKQEIAHIKTINDFKSTIVYEPLTFKQKPPTEDPSLIISKEKTAFNALTLPYFEFVFDKTKITNNPKEEINQVLDYMERYPQVTLEIVGHTDDVGNNDYNLKLSTDRAQKVMELLIERGANPSRLVAFGCGALEALDTNATDEGRQRNRRVEFRLVE